jgi:hypothetical protein
MPDGFPYGDSEIYNDRKFRMYTRKHGPNRQRPRSLNGYNEKIADEQKQDLANIQSAQLDLAQMAMKYGVK